MREGFSRKHDMLTERLFNERSSKGTSRGHVVECEVFERMLDEYCQIVGWDVTTDVPTTKRLEELGIEK